MQTETIFTLGDNYIYKNSIQIIYIM